MDAGRVIQLDHTRLNLTLMRPVRMMHPTPHPAVEYNRIHHRIMHHAPCWDPLCLSPHNTIDPAEDRPVITGIE